MNRRKDAAPKRFILILCAIILPPLSKLLRLCWWFVKAFFRGLELCALFLGGLFVLLLMWTPTPKPPPKI